MQQPIERVRGFADTDIDQYQRSAAVRQVLQGTFSLAGYLPVDVPVLEYLELYMRKSGAQVLSKLYGFTDQGRREVALRPEFTASVIRALAPSVGRAPEPLRVSYAGPVFRYEKPQRATTRQFTQAGVELLGDPSPAADADLLALACQAARAAGVPDVHAVVGHLGPLRALLAHLQVDGYAEGYLLEHLEFYSRGAAQQDLVRRQLGLDGEPDEDEESAAALAEGLAALSPDSARAIVQGLLQQMGVDLEGNTRSPDEIIERVLDKSRRRAAAGSVARRESLERALAFCAALSQISGEPTRVLLEATRLLHSYHVPPSALDGLRDVMTRLEEHDLDGVQVTLAPGMARGIAYYSGLIFELYASPAGGRETEEVQICGGGRYDALPLALTGRAFPALGFAFGLERLLHCLPDSGPSPTPPRVAVVWSGVDRRAAIGLTRVYRRQGWIAILLEESAGGTRLHERLRRAGYEAMVHVPQTYPADAAVIAALSLLEGPPSGQSAFLQALHACTPGPGDAPREGGA